jgi:VanZ family protein
MPPGIVQCDAAARRIVRACEMHKWQRVELLHVGPAPAAAAAYPHRGRLPAVAAPCDGRHHGAFQQRVLCASPRQTAERPSQFTSATASPATTPESRHFDSPPTLSHQSAQPSRSRARIGFGVWSVVIVAATIPWTDLVGHTHWQKVQWIPFRSPPVKLLDVVANVALYLPFGYLLARASASRARIWHAAALAGALSLVLEWTQLYSHSRFPSVQDVVCNILGSSLGAWWASTARRE